MKFTEFNFNEQLLEAISYLGFETAMPVQEKVIPIILDNKDLIACAQTGTGKTAAFVLPVLNKIIGNENKGINTLIIVPTRELAIQVEQQVQGFSYFISAGSVAIYGGGDGLDWATQKNALMNGVDLVVATPGKLLSHLKAGYVNFKNLKHLILDEADRMLDMGFIDDLQAIISYLPGNHQTLMFSATMPDNIRKLAQKILHNPEEVSFSISKPAEGVDQKAYFIAEDQKVNLIKHILSERIHFDSIIIFTSSKSKVSEIVRALKSSGFPSRGISSNLTQDEREEVLLDFRSKQLRIIVATDVISRGIDIKELNLVINFDVPHDAEDYVHRVGRTARVNAKGEAITLVTPKEVHKLQLIEKLIETIIPKMQTPESMVTKQVHTGNRKKTLFKQKFKQKKRTFKNPGAKSSHHTSKNQATNYKASNQGESV